ncbi:ABC transporter substrate-binding protein [Paenibacillus sp. CAA11]|uniref:iron-hydroxamate ABC transporter substrate-binding protein n=1 Tax=Paenibacillus sp. CAA11 TaxID=1532905 RepID=UPI000D3B3CDF|nr:iron-hydroxamate ABC transporter substrate-binding protein [Paenibacillus sp. CAA11]AWB46356.1 ABC transporter substrate-binding protein [Paenibacillus sp. CAA11]
MFHSTRGKFSKAGYVLVSLLLAALVLAACGNQSNNTNSAAEPKQETASKNSTTGDQASDRVVKDAMGHEVKIPANPQRILASYLEDPLVTLGVTPVAQWSVADGKSIQDYLQNKLQGVPTIGYDLPPEQVASFKPDLILVGSESSVQKGLYEQYNAIAPTYVLGDAVNKDWRETLKKIGELLGKSDAAEQALNTYDQKATETKERLASSVGKQSAAIMWLTQKQFYIVGPKVSSGAVVYGDLGMTVPKLVSELPDGAASWNSISLEKLSELDADHIFLINSDKGQDASTLNNPIWKGLKAVKEGHVYEMDTKSSWLYSGALAGEQMMDDVTKALVK